MVLQKNSKTKTLRQQILPSSAQQPEGPAKIELQLYFLFFTTVFSHIQSFLSCITCMSTFATMVLKGTYPIKRFHNHVNLRHHRFCTHVVLFKLYNMYVNLPHHNFEGTSPIKRFVILCQPSPPSFSHTYSPFFWKWVYIVCPPPHSGPNSWCTVP